MNYEQRFVIFIDILGFRNSIDNSSCDEILDVLNFIDDFFKDELEEKTSESKQITLFSDSIIISFKLDDPENKDEIFHSIYICQIFAVKMILRGVFVRGGDNIRRTFS